MEAFTVKKTNGGRLMDVKTWCKVHKEGIAALLQAEEGWRSIKLPKIILEDSSGFYLKAPYGDFRRRTEIRNF
jgi:hypothetical protein